MSAATNIPVPEPLQPVPVTPTESVEFRRRMGSISRHSLVYFAGTLFTAAAGYFFKIYVARALGAEALGLYALGMSMVGFIGIFNAVGLPTAGARFVAEYSSKSDFARLGAFLRGGLALLGAGNVLLGGILLGITPWIAVRIYHAPALVPYAWSFAAIMLLGVLNAFLGQCMAGFRAVAQRSMITQFAGTTATIVIAIVLIGLHFGLAGYLIAQVASAAMVLGLLAVSVWKLTPPAARQAGGIGRIEKKVVAFSAATFGIAAVHFVLAYADKITLACYLNARQVGVYAVAMSVAAFVPVALMSVNQMFSPMIAELHSTGNHALLQRLFSSITKWVVVVTAPLALTVIFFSRSLMTIFGPGFEGGAIVLVVGTIAQLFNCGVGSVGFLLLMSGHQVSLMKIQAANAAAMVALNLLLVPRWGILGAAIAAGVAVAGTNLWALLEARRKLGLHPYDRTYLKLVVPAVMTVVVLAAERSILAWHSWPMAALGLVSAYVVFLGGMFMLGLGTEDRMLARMAWNKVRYGQSGGESDERYA